MNVLLIFPPGWSLTVGNPHIALPMLAGTIKQMGCEVRIMDLNLGIADYLGAVIEERHAVKAAWLGTMRAMNEPYFAAEDFLNRTANQYGGEWNIQLGFSFVHHSFRSSEDVRVAVKESSPFTFFYKDRVLPSIAAQDPQILGFNIASVYQIIPALHLVALLRESGYKGLIIFGGNTITRLKDEIKNERWLFELVDAFVYEQGELPLSVLIEVLQNGSGLSAVPNFIWQENGTIRVNPSSPFQDPNVVPTPDFSNLSVGDYWGINYLPLVAARGCYFGKCDFCAIPYGFGRNGFAGIRNVDNVFNDILSLQERFGIHRYKFMDEALPPKILIGLSERISNQQIPIEWEAYLRLENCWKDLSHVRRVARAGFRKAYFGLEIVAQGSRNCLGKNDNGKDIVRILHNCYQEGVKVHLFCMFGYPGTGVYEAEKTLDFILQNCQEIDTVDLNPFTYSRHTNVACIKKIVKPRDDWALEYDYEPLNTSVLSSQEVEELTARIEDKIWAECPRLLHPTYRMVSPWRNSGQARNGKPKCLITQVTSQRGFSEDCMMGVTKNNVLSA